MLAGNRLKSCASACSEISTTLVYIMFDIQIAMYIKKNKLTNFSAAIIFAKYRLDLSSQTPTTTPYFRFLEYQNQKT